MARDLLATGSTWLQGKRKSDASKVVSYARDSETVEIRATKTRSASQLVDAATGILTDIREWDWLMNVADLVLDGDSITPAVGDRITETIDSETYVYEVLATGAEACWRFNDRNQATYRVHTKQIA